VHLEVGVRSQPAQETTGERILLIAASRGGGGDEPLRRLTRLLESQGCAVETVPADRALAQAVRRPGELCILVPVAGPDGLDLLHALREAHPDARLVVLCERPDLGLALELLRLGAFDCLEAAPDEAAVAALAARLRAAGDSRLRAYTQSLQALTPGLVHELRNPLSGILGSGQMLGRLIGENPRAQDYIRILREEALQLERFLARLAEFGRLPRGGICCGDPLQLTRFLGGLLEEWRPRCLAHGITQVTRFAPAVPGVRAEPSRLALALGELLDNAIEAMPAGGTLTVSTRLVPGDPGRDPARPGTAEILVADTGPGMAEEVRRRALEPFFSAKPRALGIGLALAQAVLAAHGGDLGLDSRPGAGTRVALRLPLAPGGGNGHEACAARAGARQAR